MSKTGLIGHFSALKLLLVLCTVAVQAQDYPTFPWDNIIMDDEKYFTNTQYYQLYYEFMEGIEYSKLEYATQCRSHFSALLDDFYFLYQEHLDTDTADGETLTAEGFEARVFNVTGIISGPYQQTM